MNRVPTLVSILEALDAPAADRLDTFTFGTTRGRNALERCQWSDLPN